MRKCVWLNYLYLQISVSWLESRPFTGDKSVSRATVYRTLPLLTESGLVREMDFGKDYKFYDPNYADHPDHSHIICYDCEKIVEFDSETIAKIEGEIAHKLGFSLKTQRLQIMASCDIFKKWGRCRRKR